MKLTVISGRSGSGKSTVLHILEDRGYYCIDNLPASLLPALADRLSAEDSGSGNVAVSIDARNISSDLEMAPDLIRDLENRELPTEVIFLDANSQTLLKRFSESRRRHPLTNDKLGLREAIDKESELLEPISVMASLSIDTSNMSLHELRDAVLSRMVESSDVGLSLLFQSFGYKNGVPVDADLVFDVRCLPNPYWDRSLRAFTGQDQPVIDFMDKQREAGEMFEDIAGYLHKWLPEFDSNNRSYITVAVGCTGGQHRSVYLCEKLRERFTGTLKSVLVRHRELRR